MPHVLNSVPLASDWRSRFRRMSPGERLHWLGSDQALFAFSGTPHVRQRLIRELKKLRRRLEAQTCSEPWLDDTWSQGVRYAPHHPCGCDHCRLRRLWPGGRYVGSRGISYECFLERRTCKWYLLPSSPSARAIHAMGELTSVDTRTGEVRRGGKLASAVRMLPESEEALRREIARFLADGKLAPDRRAVNPHRVVIFMRKTK